MHPEHFALLAATISDPRRRCSGRELKHAEEMRRRGYLFRGPMPGRYTLTPLGEAVLEEEKSVLEEEKSVLGNRRNKPKEKKPVESHVAGHEAGRLSSVESNLSPVSHMHPDIPSYIWHCGVATPCVEYYMRDSPLFGCSIKTEVAKRLPLGWKFVSHVIAERDSFGPVTSLLTLQHDNGTIYQGLI